MPRASIILRIYYTLCTVCVALSSSAVLALCPTLFVPKQYREHAIHRPGGTLREGRMAQHSLADGASHNQPLPRNMDHKASAMHKVAKDVAHNFQAMQRGDPRLAVS